MHNPGNMGGMIDSLGVVVDFEHKLQDAGNLVGSAAVRPVLEVVVENGSCLLQEEACVVVGRGDGSWCVVSAIQTFQFALVGLGWRCVGREVEVNYEKFGGKMVVEKMKIELKKKKN